MKIALIAPLLILCTATTIAFAQAPPRAVQSEDKRARPVLIISPKFPDATPADKLPVEVRISGTVNEAGVLTSPAYLHSEGKEIFIRAIEEVLPQWRFKPAVDEESCQTVSSVGTMSVWFEEKGGRPIVSVSMPLKSKGEDALERIVDQYSFVRRPNFEYPQAARRVGMEGATELLFKVNEEGDVLQATLVFSTPNKVFGEAAIEATKRVKFVPRAPDKSARKIRCIVFPLAFCLTDGADYPNSACGKRETK